MNLVHTIGTRVTTDESVLEIPLTVATTSRSMHMNAGQTATGFRMDHGKQGLRIDNMKIFIRYVCK